MRWILVRHGATQGNLEGRYVGCRTDEPLCPEGRRALSARAYPPAALVFASPMKRCLETAALIYPGVPVETVDGFRECDFGLFENKNHAELNGRRDYQEWIDSLGSLPFPGGESRSLFSARCLAAFEALREKKLPGDCAVVAHGGTIMAIMEEHARPKAGYYDFQVKNGQGFLLEEDGSYSLLPDPCGR